MEKELIAKAKEAKSPEELIALAKKSGVELTEAEAKAYLGKAEKSDGVADEELDSVAGGLSLSRPVQITKKDKPVF